MFHIVCVCANEKKTNIRSYNRPELPSVTVTGTKRNGTIQWLRMSQSDLTY